VIYFVQATQNENESLDVQGKFGRIFSGREPSGNVTRGIPFSEITPFDKPRKNTATILTN
jgi:hypothetical protein